MFFERKGHLFIARFAGLFRDRVIYHGFSTRKGGVSRSRYRSLNLGYGTGDSVDRVEKNRNQFFRSMGISLNSTAVPEQIHGIRIARVTEPGKYSETDGLVTDTPGISLVVQVADCLPIYFYDLCRKAIGLAHAGWKGTVLRISSKVVLEMKHQFGTRPQDLWVFFGPSIGPCCYDVGQDVSGQFSSKYLSGGKLDLWQINRDLLVETGVKPERIVMSRLCTVCHPEWFYSHRASGGSTGRMMAILGLRD
jgi:YfiH family protein